MNDNDRPKSTAQLNSYLKGKYPKPILVKKGNGYFYIYSTDDVTDEKISGLYTSSVEGMWPINGYTYKEWKVAIDAVLDSSQNASFNQSDPIFENKRNAMKLTPNRKLLIENKIKKLMREVIKESGGQKWKGSMNVKGTPVQFEWWSEDRSVKITESDKYALMASAKDDISYAITKQDASSGKLNYGDTFVGTWKMSGNKLKESQPKESGGMGNAETVWSGSGWTIKKYKNRGGTMSLSVENDKTGFIDYPIYYDHNGQIAYDTPEKVPQPIKNKVTKLYPTIK